MKIFDLTWPGFVQIEVVVRMMPKYYRFPAISTKAKRPG